MASVNSPATISQPVQTATPATPSRAASLVFPQKAIIGSLGWLARVLAANNEVPEEFYFVCALTLFGAAVTGRLTLDLGVDVEPRLFSVVVGESANVRKSTSMKQTIKFFEQQLGLIFGPHLYGGSNAWAGTYLTYGAGSAEGLARELTQRSPLTIAYDELRTLLDKCRVQGSVLLELVSAMFEQNNWDNSTKHADQSFSVRNGHLSIVGCCTLNTYQSMWTREAIAIGFDNRLFVVSADRRRTVAWPGPPDPSKLGVVAARIKRQLGQLPPTGAGPLKLGRTPDAKKMWEDWYEALPDNPYTKRLDAIGFRLMALLAFTCGKSVVDKVTVERVISILDYEHALRRLIAPIDVETIFAKVEEKIRRALSTGALSKRDLYRKLNANREGVSFFNKVLKDLVEAGEVIFDKAAGTYQLTP